MLSYEQRNAAFGPRPSLSGTSHGRAITATGPTMTSSRRHIWIITGPAGCGKSTVGQYLANEFRVPYIEGDEFHPKSNIEKMAKGIPLNDMDRWDWLIALRQEAISTLGSAGAEGVVLTCSALKRKYRDVIRIAHYDDSDVMVHFLYLRADEETLKARVRARKGHYMKDGMVHSQFSSLEEPDCEQDSWVVDVTGTKEEVNRQARCVLLGTLENDNARR